MVTMLAVLFVEDVRCVCVQYWCDVYRSGSCHGGMNGMMDNVCVDIVGVTVVVLIVRWWL